MGSGIRPWERCGSGGVNHAPALVTLPRPHPNLDRYNDIVSKTLNLLLSYLVLTNNFKLMLVFCGGRIAVVIHVYPMAVILR